MPATSLTVDESRDVGFALTPDGGIGYTPRTGEVLAAAGGVDGIIRITTRFYEKFHADAHLRQFLGGLQQPLEVHARRLGSYIAEMMGASGAPWTTDTRTNTTDRRQPIKLANGRTALAADRFSAHHCAWHSVDRPREKVGRRFKLDDCRVWMRLFFWAVRDSGFDERTDVFRYLQRFICHFIAIYETTARPFTLLESRWSADARNTDAYISGRNGAAHGGSARFMDDVVDVPFRVAIERVPPHERSLDAWLYDSAKILWK